MFRWLLLLSAISFLACSGPSQPLEEILPVEINGWTRTHASSISPEKAPDVVRQLGLKRAVATIYTGEAAVPVRVYEMNVPTSAFELIQKWRQQDGLAVYTGPYFLVADPSGGPAAAGLLESLRKSLE
jgi:hypothetical protein